MRELTKKHYQRTYKKNMNGLRILVLAKQVPDTRNVGKDAMKEDGTVNRAALAAIFNPEDLNALEQALSLKDRYPGTTITMLSMGPARAAEVIAEGLYRGADKGYLLTGREFAGSDTLATSYALSRAIRSLGGFDLIVAGRQAIDGDTAQVGPQVAEKLGLPQITYAEEILEAAEGSVTVKRRLERGVEVVRGAMPMVVTVTGSAAECRPRNAKLTMKFKNARTLSDLQNESEEFRAFFETKKEALTIGEIQVADIDADPAQLGMQGSPTKVKTIESVVLEAKESKSLRNTDEDIEALVVELIGNHTIG